MSGPSSCAAASARRCRSTSMSAELRHVGGGAQAAGADTRRDSSALATSRNVAAAGVDLARSCAASTSKPVTSNPALAELHRQRQADVAEADDADPGLVRCVDLLFQGHLSYGQGRPTLRSQGARDRRRPSSRSTARSRPTAPSRARASPCWRRRSGDRLRPGEGAPGRSRTYFCQSRPTWPNAISTSCCTEWLTPVAMT